MKFIFTLVCLLLMTLPLAHAEFVASIIDDAHLFSPDERATVAAALEELRRESGLWMVVDVLPTLEGRSIEEVASRKFRELGVGEKGRNNGLLLMLVPSERKMRLEVGYGLEGTIPDITARRLLDEILRPALRGGTPALGVLAVIQKIAGIAAGSEKEWLAHPADERSSFLPILFLSGILCSALLCWIFFRLKRNDERHQFSRYATAASEPRATEYFKVFAAKTFWPDLYGFLFSWILIFFLSHFFSSIITSAPDMTEQLIGGVLLSPLGALPGLILGYLLDGWFVRKHLRLMKADLSTAALKRLVEFEQAEKRRVASNLRVARDSRSDFNDSSLTSFDSSSDSSGFSSSSSSDSMGGGGDSGGGGSSSDW